MRQINKVSNRIIALLVCVMMLLSMLPVSIFTALAADVTSLSTNVDKQTYYVGQEHEFTYTTNVSAEHSGKSVVGAFKLLNGESIDVISTAIEKLWYWDTTNGQWEEFPAGYFQFGPPSGFPFNDGYTSKFKAKFAQSGNYKVVAEMRDPSDETIVYASSVKDIVVVATASELQSDITAKDFEINAETEFTYTTVPNDLLNTMVLGTFTLKDSSGNDAEADVKLEYWNVNTNTWDGFYGDFGPATTGFPLTAATSKFRATFNKTGTYTVEAAMKKFDGGEILCTNKATIEVKDTTSPVISEITGAPTDWTKDDVTLTVVAEDNSGLVSQYRANEGVWQNSAEFNVSANGTYKFEAKDASGNISFETITIDKIDKTAPNASVQLAPDALNPDGSWTKDEITVTINATENESGIDKYYVDGNPQTENTFKLTDSNDHDVKVVDKAGNESAIVTFSAKYDATAPVINDITGNPTEWTKDDVTLTVLATDAGCNGIQYKLDEGEWQSSNAFVVTENKDYTVYVKDLLGNTASEVVSVTKIDKSKPTISDYAVTTENWTNGNVTVSGKFADNSGDTITAYYKVGTGSWQPLTLVGENKFEIIVSDECNTTYSVKAVDKAGNEFVSTEKTVKIDKTKATLTVNDVPAIWKNNQISVTGTVSDAASGIKTAKYSINSTNGVTDSGDVVITGSDYAFTTSVSKTGTYTYTITATDNAGNIKDVTTSEIKIDLADPTVDNVVPSISGWTNKAVTVTVTVSDTDSGIDKVYYKKDGGAETEIIVNEGIYAFTIPNSADDNSNYEIYCYDKAGNISAKSNYTAQIDVTNPSKPEIKYNKTAIGTFFETITFGLYKADIEVTITSSDALSGVKEIVYYKGTEEVRATPVAGKVVFPIAPNFKGKITAIVVDNAGNNSDEQTVGADPADNAINGVIVDDKIPVVDTANPDVDTTKWIDTDVKITGTVSDNLSNVEKVFWRQGDSETENPATLNVDGTYEFIVPAQDYEGTISVVCYDYSTNKSVDKVIDLKMDITIPIVKTAEADKTTWTNGNITVTGAVSDNLSGVKNVYWRQGESTTENPATLNPDGTYQFTVSAQDYEGVIYVGCYDNVSHKAVEKELNIYMDITDPTVDEAIANVTVWTNGDVVVTGKVSDNLSGAKKVYWRQGSDITENPATLNSDDTYRFTIPAQNYEGHIYIGCYDNADNKADESFVAVKMDATIPVVNTGVADPSVWTNCATTGGILTITGTVSDSAVNGASSGVAAVKYIYDNHVEQVATLNNGNYEVLIPATNYDGDVTIWCLDNAGNKSEDFKVAVKMDVQNPKVNSGVAVSDDWTNQAVVISGTVGDIEANASISGVKTVKYLDTTGNPQTADTFISSTGEYTINIPATDYFGNINVWCEDNAGNRSDNYPVEVKMDVTAPSVPQIEYKQTVLDTVLEVITFGFFKADLEVVITSDDNFDSQDDTLKEIEFIYEGAKGKYDDTPVYKTGKPAVDANNEITFTIPSDFRGSVKARAFDKAGNESAWTDEGTAPDKNDAPVVLGGVIVDETSPTRKVTYTPERILDATTMLDVDEVNEGDNVILYYKESATVKFEVTESNFYADDVIIKVSKNGAEAEPIAPNDWSNEGNVWTGTITLSGDGDYVITMDYTDRSTNVMDTYTSQEIRIDATAPVIDVEIEPEKDETGYIQTVDGKEYYNTNRKATITVTEHNFLAEDVLATITAKDVTGKDVAISNFDAYLKNRANWISNGDVHVAEITFATDAQYTFKFDSEDIIGNKADQYVAPDFVIDHEKPDNLTIAYSEEIKFWQEVLETITFGYYSYNPDVIVTITADDITSGVDYFEWDYTREANVSETLNVASEDGKIIAKSAEQGVKLNEITYSADKKTATTSLKLTADQAKQYRGSISFSATDRAGNKSAELNDDKRINIVDTIAPTRTVSYTPEEVRDANTLLEVSTFTEKDDVILYYKNSATATFKVNEANFYKEDVKIKVSKNGGEAIEKVPTDWMQNGDEWTGTITLSGDGDYVITMDYTDRSTNVMDTYTSQEIRIDATAPVIDVKYEPKDADANGKYFKQDRKATITVTEHNFLAEDVLATITAKDVTGKDVAISNFDSYLKNRANWTSNGDVHVAEITFATDAQYTFKFDSEDIIGNKADQYVAPDFVIDHAAPNNLTIDYSEEIKFWQEVLETITFGFYSYNPDVVVTITADDITSGVDYFEWKYTRQQNVSTTLNVAEEKATIDAKSAEQGVKLNEITYSADKKTATTSFKLTADQAKQYRGSISFSATDRAGNKSAELNDDKRINIVDTIAPTRVVNYTDAQRVVDATTLLDVDSYTEGSNVIAYYNTANTVTLTVTEANFYKKDVNVIVTKNGANYPVQVGWTDNSVDVHVGTFTLTENGDYIVKVSYKDRSSNEMVNYESHKIVIDTIKPIISVDYENKAADALNVLKDLDGNERQYFYDDQTATITIEEHNFRADDVKVLVKAKDLLGNNVTVGTFKFDESGNVKEYFADGQKRENWSEYEVGTFRRADDTYQMTIKYSADANYTFDIEYADLATNPDKDAETRKTDYFTVDKTAPSNLKVKYSTNVFENILEDITFGYYNAQMTVTISADDDISGVYHFVYSYLKKAGVSGVNAELIDDAIKEAGITRDGKTYTTEFKIPKLALKEDNQFNGIIEFAAFDRSENKSNPLKDESTVIVVDNITPTSKISYNEPIQKVEDVSYYAGDINATVVVTEANFYKEDVKITVTKDGATYPVDVKWVDDSVDVHTGTFTLTEDGDYIVNVVYKDRSQNEMIPYTSNQLTIDTKDPVINVSDVKHQSANNQETISFTVSVTDTNIALDSFKPTLNALIKKDNGSNSYSYETISIPLGTASTTVNNNGETVHSYTVNNLEVDGYYSLVCTAIDYANHSVTKINSADNAGGTASVDTMNFSVNRDGSVFWIETEHNDKYTGETFKDKLNGAYANDTVTIKLHEVNVDKVDENADKKTVFTLNDGSESEDIVLTEENYEKNVSVGIGGWYKNVYTLNNDNFDHDGVYSLNIITYDAATNSNVNTKTEAGTISFTLDRTKPVITANVKTEQRINDTEFPVEFKITETNLNAETISVTLKDRNGKTVETTVEELGNNEYKFMVNDGLNYSFEITAKDLAGNESEILKVERFTVSTNILVLWYANTPLFWGSIAGTIILAGAIIFFIFYKKKKKEQN